MTLEDRELDRRLEALPRSAPVDELAWRRIERRIRPRWRLPAAAAAVLAASVTAVVVFHPADSDRNAERMQTLVNAEVRAMRAAAPSQPSFAEFDSPEALMQAWHENDKAIAELERALKRDPGNRLLLEFLADARLRQARLANSGLNVSIQQRTTL